MNRKKEEPIFLYDRLKQYGASEMYPFHMPGHKRNRALLKEMWTEADTAGIPFQIDITEIDGFDNLHHAEGILQQAQERAAALYGAEKSFYLINGSTCGLLAAIFACTTQHGKILMARNCHKAVYHAVELRELETVYVYPERYGRNAENAKIWSREAEINGPISAEEVEQILQKEKGIQAVVLTSPTYDGVVSDIAAIAEVVHGYQIPLIVDEAHGAHFGFHSYFPDTSLKQGADLVIHSLHKTLPSLTQTALLHIGKGAEGRMEQVKKYLDIFETSSPSYVFMAGMDQCIRLIEENGERLFAAYAQRLQKFRREVKELPYIHILGCEADCIHEKDGCPAVSCAVSNEAEYEEAATDLECTFAIDPGKLVIAADGWTGLKLADFLRKEEQIEVEMAAAGYVIALTSVADTDEGFERLKHALIHISKTCSTENVECEKEQENEDRSCAEMKTERWEKRKMSAMMTIAQASAQEYDTIPLEKSEGYVSREYMYLYPPGIPLVVPGEKITAELLRDIKAYQRMGMEIQGLRDYRGKEVDVCRKV